MASPAGPGLSDARQEIVLFPGTDREVGLPLYRAGSATERQRDVSLTGQYGSGDSRPTKDVVRRVHTFAWGAGWSRRPAGLDESVDWTGYADGSNVCTRFGYVVPGGEQTPVSVTAGWGRVVKIIPFNGDLWFVFLNRIAYIAGGVGTTLTDYYSNSGDQFTDAEYWQGSLRVALQCSHTSTGIHFFVTITPTGGSGSYAAALNPTPASPAGTAATVASPQCRLLQTAFWEYQGTAALRLTAQVSDTQYRYMITPSGDPYDDANWSAAIRIGESTFEIRQIVSSHDTIWVIKQDGVYAVTDKNANAGGENITPYWKDQIDADATASVAHYWQDKLIVGRNTTIEAIDVNSWQVQDAPRPIHISHGRPNDTRINGRYSAIGSDSGWLVAVLTAEAGAQVMYGTPRRRESPVAGVTEMDWFGPEVGPLAGIEINEVTVHTPESTLRPSLWLGGFGVAGAPYLLKVDLFKGSSPLADSGHRYHSLASLTLTDEHWAARSATKGALSGMLAVRNCGSGRRVDLYVAVGANASFPSSPQVEVGEDVETHAYSLPEIRGSTIRRRINLLSDAVVPTVLDEIETRANLGFPLAMRGSWLVDVSDLAGHSDLPTGDDPDEVEAALVALCEGVEAIDVLCDDGETRTVVFDNVLPFRNEETSASQRKRKVFELRYTVVEAS